MARITSILRRLKRGSSIGSGNRARFSGWIFDVEAHALISPGEETVSLSRAETQLLELLARAPHRVLTREFILDAIGGAPTFDRTIDVRISRLRQKLERNPRVRSSSAPCTARATCSPAPCSGARRTDERRRRLRGGHGSRHLRRLEGWNDGLPPAQQYPSLLSWIKH